MTKHLFRFVLAALLLLPLGAKAQLTLLDEGFSSGSPTGWQGSETSVSTAFGGATLSRNNSISWNYASSAKDGLEAGHYYVNVWSSQSKWIITPSVDLTAASGATLTFDLALTQYNSSSAPTTLGSDKKFMVVVSADDGTSWPESNATKWQATGGNYTLASVPTTYQTYTIDLDAYVGHTVKIGFYAESSQSSQGDIDFHLDNVKVTGAVSCYAPTGIAFSNISTEGATASWQPSGHGEESYQYVLVAAGQTPDWSAAQSTSGTTATLSGLSTFTEYDFHVRSWCAADDQSAAAKASFTTALACPEGSTYVTAALGDGTLSNNYLPFSSNTYSATWQLFRASELEEQDIYGGTIRALAWHCKSSSDIQATFKIYMGHTSDDVLPADTLSRSEMTLVYDGTTTFHANQWDNIIFTTPFLYNGVQNLVVMVVRDEAVTGSPYSQMSDWCYGSSSPSYHYGRSYYRLNTRFTMCATNLTCYPVQSISVAQATADSVTLRWTDGHNSGASYMLLYGTTIDDIQQLQTAAGDTAITVRGLLPDTAYSFVLAPVCSETDTGMGKGIVGTTLNNQSAITSMAITTSGISRGEAVIDAAEHSVTLPIYYTTNLWEIQGTIGLSKGATMYLLDRDGNDSINYVNITYNMRYLKLVQSEPKTVRVYAEDRNYHTDWTITAMPESCTSPRSLTLEPERVRLTARWSNPDTLATAYQLCISQDSLSEEQLATADLVSVSNATEHTFSGLDRETEYHVFLRTDCGGEQSPWLHASVTTKGTFECTDGYEVAVNGTTGSGSLPVYGYTASNKQLSQSLYPASMLTSYVGKQIKGLKYFASSGKSRDGSSNWEGVDFIIRMAISDSANLNRGWDHSEATTVYTGHLATTQNYYDNTMEILLDQPFLYTGGNLLIEFDQPTEAGRASCEFYRLNTTDTMGRILNSTYQYNNNYKNDAVVSIAAKYLPKVAFIACEQLNLCPDIATVSIDSIEHNSARIAWTAAEGDYLSEYQLVVSDSVVSDFEAWTPEVLDADVLAYTATGLLPNHEYHVYVKAACNAEARDEGESGWTEASFTTAPTCRMPASATVTLTGKHTASLAWERGETAHPQADNFGFALSTTELADPTAAPTLSGIDALGTALAGLRSATTYYAYVWNVCDGNDASPWTMASFTTADSMPAVVGLHADTVEHNAFTARWQRDEEHFADENAWRICLMLQDSTVSPWTTTYAMSQFFYGLTAESEYTLMVAAIDTATGRTSDTVRLAVLTAAPPSASFVVGTGNGSSEYVPVKGSDMRYGQHIQTIYTADDLAGYEGRTITSLHYFVTSGGSRRSGVYEYSWEELNFTVKMAHTAQSLFSSDFISLTSDDVVYSGHLRASADSGMTVVFDTPFTYNGGNLIIDFETPGNSSNSNCNSSCYFAADYIATGRTYYKINGQSSYMNTYKSYAYVPKVEFGVQMEEGCLPVRHLAVGGVTRTEAKAAWYPGDAESQWQYVCASTPQDSNSLEAAAQTVGQPSLSLTALAPATDYRLYVRGICSESDNAPWDSVSFSTENWFTIAATNANPEMGSVIVAHDTMAYGEVDTLVAVAFEGHSFLGWSNGVSTDTLFLTVSRDTTVTARFAVKQFNVSVSVNNATMGRVEGLVRTAYGDVDTLVAVAAEGYHFTGWSNGVGTDTLFLAVSGDTAVVASFAINRYAVHAAVNDSTMGTATASADSADHGTPVTFTATPDSGFLFTGWSNGSTASVLTVSVVSDTTLTASFEAIPEPDPRDTLIVAEGSRTNESAPIYGWFGGKYQHSQLVYPASMLRSMAGASVESVTFFADTTQSDHADFEFTSRFTVRMGEVADSSISYTQRTFSNEATLGTVHTGTLSLVHGELTITFDQPYSYNGGHLKFDFQSTPGSESRTYFFGSRMDDYASVTNYDNDFVPSNYYTTAPSKFLPMARFTGTGFTPYVPDTTQHGGTDTVAVDTVWYTVSASFDRTMGSVTGTGRYVKDSVATLTATPNDGYRFTGWSTGETAPILRITVSSDTTVTALFERKNGIDEAEAARYSVSVRGLTLTIGGAAGLPVTLYDQAGRRVAAVGSAQEGERITLPASGIYLLRIADNATRKVVAAR